MCHQQQNAPLVQTTHVLKQSKKKRNNNKIQVIQIHVINFSGVNTAEIRLFVVNWKVFHC